MISSNINEIKTHLSSYLTKVGQGEIVIICKRNLPIAEIKPITALPSKKRPIGLAGKKYPDFKISEAFFEPQQFLPLIRLSFSIQFVISGSFVTI
jgi:antitoxin (DNA-binding transcriptional repressor) of toxin-antitoxin stability system